MRLWLLRPMGSLFSDPWHPWKDKVLGFVLCAADEESARHLAASDSDDEGPEAWLDSALSSCTELVPECETIIMRDQG